jgi:hypothetical protein
MGIVSWLPNWEATHVIRVPGLKDPQGCPLDSNVISQPGSRTIPAVRVGVKTLQDHVAVPVIGL